MTEEKRYKADRHKNSCAFTVRLDNFLMEQLVARAEMENRTRGSIVIEALEDYLYKQKED
jgi:ribbon-helix-helix protein, copG family